MKKGLLFTAILILGLSSAPVIAAEKGDCGCKANQDRVSQLIRWMDKIGDPNHPLNKQDIQKYFSQNTQQYSNGKLVANGAEELYKRLIDLREKNLLARIQIQNILVDGNKAAVRYEMSWIDQKGSHKVSDIAIIQFDKEGKVAEFWETFDSNEVAKS